MSKTTIEKTEEFVRSVLKRKNVHASKTLEDILKEKCAKKIAETLKS